MKLKQLFENGDWNKKSEDKQIMAVKRNGNVIKYIEHPSEAVQLSAVSHDAGSIHRIHEKGINPSDKILIAAINQSADIFRHIVKYFSPVSEIVQLVAVAANSWNIGEIKNPSEIVQLTAVKQHYMAILDIKNPTPSTIKVVLTSPKVINQKSEYVSIVDVLFKDNTILTKKWLRYGETMRNQA